MNKSYCQCKPGFNESSPQELESVRGDLVKVGKFVERTKNESISEKHLFFALVVV